MIDEVNDAAGSALPLATITVFSVNMICIPPFLITICYQVPDVSASVNNPILYPTIYVLRHSMSTRLTVILVARILLTVAFLQCHCLSIGYLFLGRITDPEILHAARLNLGNWGVPVGAAAMTFAFWTFFWTFRL
jgi:hypothetical protein